MEFIRQTVDDRNTAVFCQLFQIALFECTDHDAIDHSGKHLSRVADRFAATELNVVRRKEERVSAELLCADFKGNTRPCGRFCKDHGKRFAVETGLLLTILLHGFKLKREGEGLKDLVLRPVLKRQQVLLGKRLFSLIVCQIHM